jgi:hypothetical protein
LKRKMIRQRPRSGSDRTQVHQDWIELIETDGPWLSLPVLRDTWPDLDAVTPDERSRLRAVHAEWADDPRSPARSREWLRTLLGDFLGWGSGLHFAGAEGGDQNSAAETGTAGTRATETGSDQSGAADAVDGNRAAIDGIEPVHIGQHDTTIGPDFTLHDGDAPRVIGLITPPDNHPAKRMKGETWAASPIDRLLRLCAHNKTELGIATDGRFLALVYAPADGAGAYGVFDTMTITEADDLVVLRALFSLLNRRRFTDYDTEQQLPALFRSSAEREEELTETLGVQVRRAVELLVEAIGRAHIAKKARDGMGITVTAEDGTRRLVEADEVYRGAVTVMMRLVFLLFAEERRLLPTDNELYAEAYSVVESAKRLQETVDERSEAHLEQSSRHWLRLLSLFNAVHRGVDTGELSIPAYGGSLFDPAAYPWFFDQEQPLIIDDRTLHNVLKSVTTVWMSAGKQKTPKSLNGLEVAHGKRPKGEYRTLNFDRLGVEQIGYVYEGLLAWEGRWSTEVVVGLIGTQSKEAEIPLRELEQMRERAGGDADALAAELFERFGKQEKTGIGTAKVIAGHLAPMNAEDRERAERDLLAVTGNDPRLVERLLPFYGLIRTDLRGQATVVLPETLYMTESALRGNTGTHYTPKKLADEVVQGALEPLVYEPGPLQTADTDAWVLKDSDDILKLKVADIAMGSAAFLVAACRFLSERLVEAWKAEGDPRGAVADDAALGKAGEDPNLIEARRLVIEHCLYGADINPAAVEMAKLSLWLVSMDRDRPFTFLDDRLICGDSLLGITSLEQLEYMHLDPAEGQRLHEGTILDYTAHIRNLVAEAVGIRRSIPYLGDRDITDQAMKSVVLLRAQLKTNQARRYADLLVGAGLEGSSDSWLEAANLGQDQSEDSRHKFERTTSQWLRMGQHAGSFERVPIHWPLEFPEVFEMGGFDAVIGNPPFLGGTRISGSLGSSYREYLRRFVAGGFGAGGRGDLVVYFLLRARELTHRSGEIGIIATNTLAQGDTREIGLDRLLAEGCVIRSAIKGESWPASSAALEFCAVWISKGVVSDEAQRLLDRIPIHEISSTLDPSSRAKGVAKRLFENDGISFAGSKITGQGFIVPPEHARALIQADARNADILLPYLNGEDLMGRPGAVASRWIINFHDWSLERASSYSECFDQVVRLVKPERQRKKADGSYEMRNPLPVRWWQYQDRRLSLYESVSDLDQVVVLSLVSKIVMPVMVPARQVFMHMLGVFASGDNAFLGLLSSAFHYWWAIAKSSTLETRTLYATSDVFQTLPMPELSDELRNLGDRLNRSRRSLMNSNKSGMTDIYNMLHESTVSESGVVEMREIHRLIDLEVCRCYGWDDLISDLAHDHYETRQGMRYTIAPGPRQEILDRLLEENHRRYALEVEQGLHAKGAAAKKAARKIAKPKPEASGQDSLF